jgi:hypothetical protein
MAVEHTRELLPMGCVDLALLKIVVRFILDEQDDLMTIEDAGDGAGNIPTRSDIRKMKAIQWFCFHKEHAGDALIAANMLLHQLLHVSMARPPKKSIHSIGHCHVDNGVQRSFPTKSTCYRLGQTILFHCIKCWGRKQHKDKYYTLSIIANDPFNGDVNKIKRILIHRTDVRHRVLASLLDIHSSTDREEVQNSYCGGSKSFRSNFDRSKKSSFKRLLSAREAYQRSRRRQSSDQAIDREERTNDFKEYCGETNRNTLIVARNCTTQQLVFSKDPSYPTLEWNEIKLSWK